MSSSHLVIIARNYKTGEVKLALGDRMTLYGTGEEQSVVETCALIYTDDWELTLYGAIGEPVMGKRVST